MRLNNRRDFVCLLDSKHYLEIKIKNPELSKHPKKNYKDKNTFKY